jgi:thioredoxin 2
MKPRHVVCCSCSSVNRLRPDKPADAAKCGKCGERLFAGAPVDVRARELRVQIDRSDIPVLVDVWAPWCGPCKTMAPAYEAATRQLEPDFRVVKLNSDQNAELAGSLGIRGIPTMLLFRNGREASRVSGAMTTSQIVGWARANAGEG